MSSDTSMDLVPLTTSEPGFARVRRGYDPQQVEDYLDRVELALNDADARHAEDERRRTGLEGQLQELKAQMADAERRAAGRPEPGSQLGERLTRMLALAEEEAAALRLSARQEADTLLTAAKEGAAKETAVRTAELEKREQELAKAQRAAEAATVQVQRDVEGIKATALREAERELAQARARAEAMRADAQRDAEKARVTAREDVRLLHDEARREAANMTAEARRQVEELSRQRDAIGRQLQQLRDAVSAAVAPLGGPSPAQNAQAAAAANAQAAAAAPAGRAAPPSVGSSRVSPGD